MSETVLVTGGGTGAGLSVARALGAAGYALVLVGRRDEPIRAAARALGGRAIPWNITRDPESLIAIAAPVQHLVHCAGLRAPSAPGGWTDEDFRRPYEVLVSGPARLSQAFAAQPAADAPRSIVFVSPSLAPEPGFVPLFAARAASVALAGALGQALGLACQAVVGESDPGAAVLKILRGEAPDQSSG